MASDTPLSLRERARVRGESRIYVLRCPLIRPSDPFSFRPFGSLWRRGEWKINPSFCAAKQLDKQLPMAYDYTYDREG